MIGFPDGYYQRVTPEWGPPALYDSDFALATDFLGYGIDPDPGPPRHVRTLKRAGLRGRRAPSIRPLRLEVGPAQAVLRGPGPHHPRQRQPVGDPRYWQPLGVQPQEHQGQPALGSQHRLHLARQRRPRREQPEPLGRRARRAAQGQAGSRYTEGGSNPGRTPITAAPRRRSGTNSATGFWKAGAYTASAGAGAKATDLRRSRATGESSPSRGLRHDYLRKHNTNPRRT